MNYLNLGSDDDFSPESFTTASWKKWNDNGGLSQASKTHLIGDDGLTLCGKDVPAGRNVEIDYSESALKSCECKGCMKSKKN